MLELSLVLCRFC